MTNAPTIHLHNSLGRKKEAFIPLDPANVRMYVCGPTVYDFAHIGNARPVVVFDVLARLLRRVYGKDAVKYVRNITDVDDKIIARAEESGEAIAELTQKTEDAFHADMAALGTAEPDVEPRATEHIPEMIAMIESLIASDHAYEAEGHVLFRISSFDAYGQLSGRNRDEMIAGARIEIAPYKQDPADFVLWKPSSDKEPGWESPWGCGRPGWHLECSAMSEKHLGKTFDIHGGGQDLVFPHHENEIAQSCAAHGEKIMAKYWLHNGYLMAEGEKMSKSLGNFYTVHDLLDEFPGEAIRFVLLETHYRKPQDFTKSAIAGAKKTLDHWYELVRNVFAVDVHVSNAVLEALCDDLNTPKAIAELHKLAGMAKDNPEAAATFRASAQLMGLLWQKSDEWFEWMPEGMEMVDEAKIETMIEARNQARTDKNFTESDRIRDELLEAGIVLEDGTITTWRRS